MLRGSVNPYDELVAKTTDENLTTENWELILNLCDKVTDEGQTGARNVIAAVLKRLTHRNPNVQLYTLGLAESLSKNCGIEVNREIASRSFTTGLERLVTDRTAHDKVKKRALALIQQWTSEFHDDPTLGIMEELYQNLKAKNYRFDSVTEPPPPEVDDSVRRQEEEELQRVLELSMHDKGGRDRWYSEGYVASPSSTGAGSSSKPQAAPSSSSSAATTTTKPAASSTAPTSKPQQSAAAPSYGSSSATSHSAPGYSPAKTQQPQQQPAAHREPERKHTAPTTTAAPAATVQPPAASTSPKPPAGEVVTRVRALHNFEPTELGELAFEKGDIIKVVDRQYKDWWRGQLKGKTGIFPVNYVEPLPEPSPADLAKEAQIEIDVFSQAPNIDRLLSLLRGLDPLKDNLADNDELQQWFDRLPETQELYRQSVSLRPKIVKLIDKYTQKRLELQAMSDNFKIARQMFEAMMEESLAKHNPGAVYDYNRPAPGRPATTYDYGQQAYGWNPSLFGGQAPPQQPPYGPQQPYGQPGQAPAPYGPTPAPADYVQPYGPAPPVDPHSAYAQQQGYQYGTQQQAPPAVYQPQGQVPPDQQQQQPQQPQQQPPAGYPAQQQPQQAPYPQQQQYPGYGQPPAAQQQQPPAQQTPVTAGPEQPQQQQPQYSQPQPGQQQPQYGQPQPGHQPQQQPPQQQQPQGQQQAPAQGYPGYQQPGQTPHDPHRQASTYDGAAPQQQQQQQPQLGVGAAPGPVHQASMDSVPQAQPQQQPATAQPQPQPQPQQQQPQQQPAQTQPQPAAEQQPQPQQQGSQPQQGPPYVWSPTGEYPDPNATAWAKYYAMGGPDPAGRVYFTPESLPPEGQAPPQHQQHAQEAGAGPAVQVTNATPV
ncbi:ESCRT-0 subunit protein hse1 [Tulasnella sp. 427]|nr:ESCRT-0 subunit protein hse1 [Tulasnella sp. 427]